MPINTTDRAIYFAGSIRGGRDDVPIYLAIIDELKRFGRVYTEHVGSSSVNADGEAGDARAIHDRDLDWLKSSDVVVAEVTTPSLGVGYEIARATQWNKAVLCLHRRDTDRSLSSMISGCPDVTVREYTDVGEINQILESFFSQSDQSRADGE